VVNKRTGNVEAGNGTLQAALELGWTHIAAVYVDDDPTTAAAFGIADNRSGELAEWDTEALDAILGTINVDDPDLQAMLDDLKVYEPLPTEPDDPNDHWKGMPEFEQEDLTAYKTIHVHFKDEYAYKDFSRILNQKLTEHTRSIWHPPAEIGRYADKGFVDES